MIVIHKHLGVSGINRDMTHLIFIFNNYLIMMALLLIFVTIILVFWIHLKKLIAGQTGADSTKVVKISK